MIACAREKEGKRASRRRGEKKTSTVEWSQSEIKVATGNNGRWWSYYHTRVSAWTTNNIREKRIKTNLESDLLLLLLLPFVGKKEEAAIRQLLGEGKKKKVNDCALLYPPPLRSFVFHYTVVMVCGRRPRRGQEWLCRQQWKANCEIWGISTKNHYTQSQWKNTDTHRHQKQQQRLLSDTSRCDRNRGSREHPLT